MKEEAGEITPKVHEVETHQYAEIFPMMSEREMKELAEDIRVNHLREPIMLFEGKILDGRNRYVACRLAGVEPDFAQWQGIESAVRYVWSRNFTRRHLNPGQRVAYALTFNDMLAAEAKKRMSRGAKLSIAQGVANLPHPDGEGSSPSEPVTPLSDEEKGRTREKVAEIAGTSPRLVQDAKRVRDKAPEMFEKVKTGDLTVNKAMGILKNGAGTALCDPVSELVGIVAKLRKTVPKIEPLTSDECRDVAGLAKAINTLGFAFSQLVPVLLRTGDADDIELARKTIAVLTEIKLEINPHGPPSGENSRPQVSTDTVSK